MQRTNKILIIVTGVAEYQKVGYRTGLWLGELTHFWDVAERAGFSMDIASPGGGHVPLDPESLSASMLKESGTAARYEDRVFMDRLQHARAVADVAAGDYDAIFFTGGHGVMFDFPTSAALAELTAAMWQAGKVVSAVCHGPAGLLEVKLADGSHLISGKQVTGFSWNEEVKVGRAHAVPYNLEEELQKRGATYSKAWLPFHAHVVTDDRLITGQNPGSVTGVGEAVVKHLLASR